VTRLRAPPASFASEIFWPFCRLTDMTCSLN
jgi:hypothetical protein